MSVTPLPIIKSSLCVHYTISIITNEVRQLAKREMTSRYKPINVLCGYISPCEWTYVKT